MNNQLIKKEDLSIFDKIRSFFKNIFGKKKQETNINNSELKDITKNTEFENNLKVNISNRVQKEYELNNFIKEIEDNPSMVENLSNDRLDKLIKYYEDITDSKKRKIERLKASIS